MTTTTSPTTTASPTTTDTTSLAHVAAIARVAVPQFHAIADHQLRALGIGRDWVSRALAADVLHATPAGVYTFGVDPACLPRDTCAMIGILQTAGLAALTGVSSLERMGHWTRSMLPIHVATPHLDSGRMFDLAPGIDLVTQRVRALTAGDVAIVRGAPCRSAASSLMEAGRYLTPLQTASVIWKAVYAGDLDVEDLQHLLERHAFARWSRSAREALDLYLAGSSGTKSRSEDELHRLLVLAGLQLPQVNVLGAAGMAGHRPDFVWRAHRVIVEVDGRHHTDMPMIASNDRALDDVLRAQGWNVLRIPYREIWRDPAGVVARIARALGA